MFDTYSEYILPLLIVFAIIIVYLVVKKITNKKSDKDTLGLMNSDLVADPYEEEFIKNIETEKQKVIDEEKKRVEEQNKPPKPKKPLPKASEKKPKLNRIKRVVPAHDKILKDDFKIFKGTRILVAEDNLINQKVITSLLADSGMEIVIADDGQIALDILENDQNFALILMDAHMPRVDGFKATITIRKNPRYEHIAVIALSGDTAVDDVRKMNDAGMENHLEKPLNLDALYDIIYSYTEENEINLIDTLTNDILDTNKGLEVCSGDTNFYKEILTEFISNYSKSDQWIYRLLKEHKLQEAHKVALDISGVCLNIGANDLYKTSIQLIEAIDNKNSQDCIIAIKKYSKELKILLDEIHSYESNSLII